VVQKSSHTLSYRISVFEWDKFPLRCEQLLLSKHRYGLYQPGDRNMPS